MTCTIDYIKNWLEIHLTKERVEHSLGTAECASLLAEKYGEDKEKAYFTGLIHDCAKCLPKDKMNEFLKKISLEPGELENPKTHHAPVGAYLAEKEFGIRDTEILSAIRWHTIGKTTMTLFEKIIFLADKIEERTRPQECCDIKHILEEDNGLNKAILACYKQTIRSLLERNLTICTQTVDNYNEMLIKIKD